MTLTCLIANGIAPGGFVPLLLKKSKKRARVRRVCGAYSLELVVGVSITKKQELLLAFVLPTSNDG